MSKLKEKWEIPEYEFCRTAQRLGPRAKEHDGRVSRQRRKEEIEEEGDEILFVCLDTLLAKGDREK